MVTQMDNQFGGQMNNGMNQQPMQQMNQPGFQPGYQQPGYQQPMNQPGFQPGYNPQSFFRPLKTDRSMIMFLLLNLVTCGIYSIVFYSSLGEDLNMIIKGRDGKNTMHYCLMYFLLAPLTCGIYGVVWFHSLSARIGNEARARGLATNFGAGSFWLWNVLGSLILVGPFIYLYQLCSTMNMLSDDYNRKGI